MAACKLRVCDPGRWAQCATCYEHRGNLHQYLHRYLGIPLEVKITHPPYRRVLTGIKRTRIGLRFRRGSKSVVVTRKLKSMVNFALNMNPR